ncbi:MAG: DUF1206 domain-containing protein, partial [Agrococcus sp.]
MSGDGPGEAPSRAARRAHHAAHKARDAAAEVEQHRAASWVEALGQSANGLVHIVIGAIALGVAFGAGGSADQSGAMRALRETPIGGLALWT